MKANWDEDLPPAGIIDVEEARLRAYRGMNPTFVRQVWEKRRKQAPKPRVQQTQWTPERKAIVAEMLVTKHTYGQIAKKFGTTPSAIAGMIRNAPELRAIGPQSPQGLKQIEAKRRAGH